MSNQDKKWPEKVWLHKCTGEQIRWYRNREELHPGCEECEYIPAARLADAERERDEARAMLAAGRKEWRDIAVAIGNERDKLAEQLKAARQEMEAERAENAVLVRERLRGQFATGPAIRPVPGRVEIAAMVYQRGNVSVDDAVHLADKIIAAASKPTPVAKEPGTTGVRGIDETVARSEGLKPTTDATTMQREAKP